MHKFFFPERHRIGLPLSISKRMPILINLNILLIGYFALASFTRYKADPDTMLVFLLMINGTSVIYLLSLALIRFRAYTAASVISLSGLLLDVLWIGLFLPISGASDLYRLAVYLFASCVVNSMLSIQLKYVVLYAFAGIAVFIGVALLVYAPKVGGFHGEFKTVFTTLILVYIPLNLVLYFTGKLSTDLIKQVEKDLAGNKAKATALDDLISNAKGSLEIGKSLVEVSAESRRRSEGIKDALKKLRESSKGMSYDSRCTDDSNKDVVEYARKMQKSVTNQNSFLEQTSASVAEIMATIQNIAHLAEQKKKIMDAVLNKLEIQGHELKRINDGFDKIRESSKVVLGVASGILDISEKTNMLAMNASIEAAHAGSAGKGFAVISGEIRKLSQETQASTNSIGEALTRNDSIVGEAASIVSAYTSHIETVVKDVRETFYAIEEIINGLGEISKGTNELTSATGEMVTVARDTEDTINNVAKKIDESSQSVEHISEFACVLDDMIEKLEADFGVIEDVLRKVSDVGEHNITNIRKLEEELADITKS